MNNLASHHKTSIPAPTPKDYYWATVHQGQLQGVASGWPAQELASNQFPLTKQEFYLLKALIGCRMEMKDAVSLIRNIQRKIKTAK